jgi:hypothetical protein
MTLLPRVAALVAAVGVCGCAQEGSVLTRRTTIGSLKTSLAQLEHQNDQQKKQIADLQAENRRVADRLVQEQATNEELATRLDDARALISRSGLSSGALARSGGGFTSPSSRDLDDPNMDLDRPARSSSGTGSGSGSRKAPFAQIGGVRAVPSSPDEDIPAPPAEDSLPPPPAYSSSRPRTRSTAPRLDAPAQNLNWLPIVPGDKN